MKNTVGAFDFEIGSRGTLIVPSGSQMVPHWLSDDEVDAGIQALKDDLNAVAVRIKAALTAGKSFAWRRYGSATQYTLPPAPPSSPSALRAASPAPPERSRPRRGGGQRAHVQMALRANPLRDLPYGQQPIGGSWDRQRGPRQVAGPDALRRLALDQRRDRCWLGLRIEQPDPRQGRPVAAPCASQPDRSRRIVRRASWSGR
jgi:hypothetical protein